MHTAKVVTTTLLILALIGCKEKPSELSGAYTVSGCVYYQGDIVPSASIVLDSRSDLATLSNSTGRFALTNVPGGTHTLDIEKTNADGSFLAKSSQISVENDIDLQSLLLPRAVTLSIPQTATASSVLLAWSSTDASDFREYKLYRHTTSGLDEHSGTLVHVSTAIDDTSFVDTLVSPLTRYYYRTYVLNDYGHLGGSNIVSVVTPNLNLVPDGGFEDSTALSSNWIITNMTGLNAQVSITRTEAYSGLSSLHFSAQNRDTVPYVGSRLTLLSSKYIPVVPSTVYELSCIVKISGRRSNIDDGAISISQGGAYICVLYIDGIPAGQNGVVTLDWTKLSATFVAPSSTPVQVMINLSNENVWLDDFTLQPTQ